MFCCWDLCRWNYETCQAIRAKPKIDTIYTVCRSKIGHIDISQQPTEQKKILAIPKMVCVSLNVSYAVSLSETLANILWPIFVIKWKTHYIFSKQSKTELTLNRQDFSVISFHQTFGVDAYWRGNVCVCVHCARIQTCVQMMWAWSIDIWLILRIKWSFRISIVTCYYAIIP